MKLLLSGMGVVVLLLTLVSGVASALPIASGDPYPTDSWGQLFHDYGNPFSLEVIGMHMLPNVAGVFFEAPTGLDPGWSSSVSTEGDWLMLSGPADWDVYWTYNFEPGLVPPSTTFRMEYFGYSSSTDTIPDESGFLVWNDPNPSEGSAAGGNWRWVPTSTVLSVDDLEQNAAPVPSVVPEPASLLVLGMGIAGLITTRMRRTFA